MLRFLTAGESHGKAELAIVEGFPAGVKIDVGFINEQLAKRQQGYGRGKRMKIEKDKVDLLSGVKDGVTIGSPIAVLIPNKDFIINELSSVKAPRPGHADLAGLLKYDFKDARCVLERASARETVARVAIGAICKQLLSEFKIFILSHVLAIGNVKVKSNKLDIFDAEKIIDKSSLRCADKQAEEKMIQLIDKAKERGDTLGGVVEVVANGIPPGLGNYVHYDRRLDAKLAQGVMSVHGIKAVEIGQGINNAFKFGSQVHDEIFYDKKKGYWRNTNRAGGLEGGITNGENIVLRGYMKPISTLMKPLKTVNIDTGKETEAVKERADVCAVPAASIIIEAMCAYNILGAFLEKFGQDSLNDIKHSYQFYLKRLERKD